MDYTNVKNTFAKYVFFNMLGMLGVSCYILVDTFFIAKGLGAIGLTSLNLAIPVFTFMNGIALLNAMGSSTKFTILKALGQDNEANYFFTQALFTSLLLSLLFVFCGTFFHHEISGCLGADRVTMDDTSIYVRTVMIFAPMFCMNNLMLCFVRNDGNPKLAMYATVIGSAANIVFDYFFIFTLRLGMHGAALATGMSPIASLFLLSSHWIKNKNHFHLCRMNFHLRILWETAKLGFSTFVNEIAGGIVIFGFNLLILHLEGTIGVAAYGIVANVALVITAMFTGIGNGMQPLISYYYGVNDKERLRKTFQLGVITAFIFGVVSYFAVVVFGDSIVVVFNKERNHQLAVLAKKGIVLYFIGMIPCGFNVVSSVYLTSREQAMKGLLISMLRGLVLITFLAYWLSTLLGVTGVWLAFPVAEAVTVVVSLYFTRKRQEKRILKEQNLNLL